MSKSWGGGGPPGDSRIGKPANGSPTGAIA